MRSRLFLTSALMVLALAGPAAARGTLDSILPDIRAQHPGRLSDAEPWTDSDGRTHYRIKWLTPEGRILFFNADADSGRFSSSGDRDVGRQWRGDGGNRSRGDDDGASQSSGGGDNGGGRRSHWNGDSGDGDTGGGGNSDWRDRHDRGGDGGDWRRGDRHGDGGSHDGGGGRGRGDWHGGGSQGGDGGHHHHGEN
jgi:hypothetical protein